MLRYRRPAHREVGGQLGHRSFSVAQQLQQPSPARLGYRSNQVWHHNTLVTANASGKPNVRYGRVSLGQDRSVPRPGLRLLGQQPKVGELRSTCILA
jgi:hypothetical protein